MESEKGHGVSGYATMLELFDKWGPLSDDCPTARTATGGTHIWLRYDGRPVGGRLGPGVDIKTHSGYVVVPPSVTPNGQYSWCIAGLVSDV